MQSMQQDYYELIKRLKELEDELCACYDKCKREKKDISNSYLIIGIVASIVILIVATIVGVNMSSGGGWKALVFLFAICELIVWGLLIEREKVKIKERNEEYYKERELLEAEYKNIENKIFEYEKRKGKKH